MCLNVISTRNILYHYYRLPGISIIYMVNIYTVYILGRNVVCLVNYLHLFKERATVTFIFIKQIEIENG